MDGCCLLPFSKMVTGLRFPFNIRVGNKKGLMTKVITKKMSFWWALLVSEHFNDAMKTHQRVIQNELTMAPLEGIISVSEYFVDSLSVSELFSEPVFTVMRFGSSKYSHTVESNNLKHIKMQITFWTQHAPPIPLWWLKFTHHTGGTSVSLKQSICRSCTSWKVQSDVILPQRGVKKILFGGGSLKLFSCLVHFALYIPNVEGQSAAKTCWLLFSLQFELAR